MKKNIAILGSTGSIGLTTLKIISENKSSFQVNLLSTNKKVEILKKQIKFFRVKNIIIHDRQKYLEHRDFFKKKKINLYQCVNDYKKKIRKNWTM